MSTLSLVVRCARATRGCDPTGSRRVERHESILSSGMPLTLSLRHRILSLLVAVAGCEAASATAVSYEPATPGVLQAGYVAVTPTAEGLAVMNQTERPVYLFAIEQETDTRADWLPCTGGPGCPALAQGERRVIAWSSVSGYAPEKRSYVLSWWHVEAKPDGSLRVGAIQRLIVTR